MKVLDAQTNVPPHTLNVEDVTKRYLDSDNGLCKSTARAHPFLIGNLRENWSTSAGTLCATSSRKRRTLRNAVLPAALSRYPCSPRVLKEADPFLNQPLVRNLSGRFRCPGFTAREKGTRDATPTTPGRQLWVYAPVAADSPAMRPYVKASPSALPPTRFVPWMPPVTSPAA